MNKKLIMFVSAIFLIGSVFAIWLVSIYSSATYRIDSQAYGGLSVVQELTGSSFNSLNGSISSTDEFIFENEAAEKNMNIIISTDKTQTNSSCSNWQNDCDVEYTFILANLSEENLQEGTNVKTIQTGQNKVRVDIDCLQYSCPQDITPTILVEKLPV